MEQNLNPNERGKRCDFVIPDEFKIVKEVLGMITACTTFGYKPKESSLRERPEGSEATERIYLAFTWGSPNSLSHEEPIRIALDVPEGIWRGGKMLMITMNHMVP
ncbi:hypothetical protein [Dinghuibacter silviterrae]|uniref:Uncharacterized protein n=1 Tax=Dinghuibacter silviterrae TaxID=1539049 RepID=A0A4R8DWN2_9BACT|nr:hypothetical protein [Dinghuibacter silviterrae]TDX01837.1 hypothetical protein EDB95_2880 [Dinghuibacter silviterrae]